MPFPTLGGVGTVKEDLQTVWTQARTIAGFVKGQSQSLRDRSAAQSISATEVLTYVDQLANWHDQLAAIASRGPGLVAHAKQQIDNPNENIAVDFNDMTTQMTATITLIVTTFPADAQGNLLFKKWQGTNTGRTVDNLLTTASLASLRTQLDALIATMN